MTQQPHPISGGEAYDRAKEYAKENPEQADAALDKVEQVIREQTGGKFDSIIDKGRETLDKMLGLPGDTPPSTEPAPPAEPARPAEPEPPAEPQPPAKPAEPSGPPAEPADPSRPPGDPGNTPTDPGLGDPSSPSLPTQNDLPIPRDAPGA